MRAVRGGDAGGAPGGCEVLLGSLSIRGGERPSAEPKMRSH
jgi:hypothetical protein